jgi:uncharacterized protein DUF4132
LKSLPKALREHPDVDRLRRFAEWLDRHATTCLAQVDTWMVSSLPVPTGLLARVFPDEAWQSALRDLVVVGDDRDEVGFLRDATDSGELRVVNLDGETVRLSPRTVTLPHPVLLEDLDDLREFAAELGVVQGVEQIHRATWPKPADADLTEKATEVREFADGKFSSRFGLAARATSLGYRVSGGYATHRVRDAGPRTPPTACRAPRHCGTPLPASTSTTPLRQPPRTSIPPRRAGIPRSRRRHRAFRLCVQEVARRRSPP